MKKNILKALRKVTGEKEVHIEFPEQDDHGDYATSVAMKIATRVKGGKRVKGKNPRVIAEEMREKLIKDFKLTKLIEKIEIAGPGFINFWLSKEVLTSELRKVGKKGDDYGSANIGKGKNVLVDYSSPNIAKYFGIGHLRSTVIGQALYNLYKFLGYKTIGDNHIGDWGTQFGVLLAQIAKTQNSLRVSDPQGSETKLQIPNLTIDKLEELYVEFNKKALENPKLWEEARRWFKKLEEGDKEARNIWEIVKEASLKEFDRIYSILGVKIDNAYGESFYEDKMQTVIEEVRKKGLSKKSKGAEILEFTNLPPAMLLKSDGATTYYTRDLATVKFRMEKFKPDLVIYEVGSEQSLHFKQVFKTAEMMGWLNGTKLVHVAHGLIRLPHGKMATRYGQTVRLEDILNEAIDRAGKIIAKSKTPRLLRLRSGQVRPGQAGRGLSEEEKKRVSEIVGIGAIKYFDLMHHPTSDIIFNWEKMFVLEGNSGPYLQYTYARTQSVLRKATFKGDSLQGVYNMDYKVNKEEEVLLRTFVHFPEVVEDAAKSYSPNLLCNYLFDLAQKYNNFYNMHKIIGSKEQGIRLALTAATGQVLKSGLRLLGIDHPEKM